MTVRSTPFALTNFQFDIADERAAFRDDRLEATARFLHEHLDRYGDPIEHIRACLHRASGDGDADGGTVTLAEADGEIVGAVVTNDTHMAGYVPENLLVYVATHCDRRGHGIGRAVMERAVEGCRGGVALHVEPDNPAVKLYEKLGFTSKYLEMRLRR
ncbi:MAG: GNAT family N-acetyltransferase [Trueperaceae bacterium]